MESPFRIYLRRSPTAYFFVDSNGAVRVTAIKTPLTTEQAGWNDPKGWEETDTARVRNSRFVALEREYGTPYQFAGDGAIILRYLDYTLGGDAQCQIEIERKNETNLLYDPEFIGDIDFSASTDNEDFYVAPIKELGLVGLLRAKMDVEVEIPIDGPEAITATVGSFRLNGVASWITAYPTPYVPNTPTPWVYYVLNEQDTVGFPITANNQTYGFNSQSGQPFWIFKANQNIYDVTVKGQVRFRISSNQSGPVNYTVVFTHGPTMQVLTTGSVLNGGIASFTVNLAAVAPFNMGTDEVVRLYVGTSPSQIDPNNSNNTPSPFTLSWEVGDTLDVSYTFDSPAFSVRGLLPAELFRRMIEKLTEGAYTGVSNYLSDQTITYAQGLDNIPARTLFLSGNSIRGIAGATIKTTLGDFFDSCNAFWSVGMSVENEIARIERRSRYYDAGNIIASFENPQSVRIQKAEEYKFKKITVGYSTQATEKVNGRDEYNSRMVLETPDNRTSKDLNLISPAIASQYTIFNTYAEYAFRNTADSPKDNDLFALEIEPFGNQYVARTWVGRPISGVASGGKSLNLGLTPKRNLLRNGPFIRIGQFGFDSSVIRYQVSERNPNLQSNLASGLIVEAADVPIPALGAALALPFLIVAVVNSPHSILSMVNATGGIVRVYWEDRGFWVEGFPVKIGCKSAVEGEYEITLLASPNCRLI